jgi:hypothetical protein
MKKRRETPTDDDFRRMMDRLRSSDASGRLLVAEDDEHPYLCSQKFARHLSLCWVNPRAPRRRSHLHEED